MSCADTIALLELAPLAGVAGAEPHDALAPDEARALREHLVTCEPCRAQAEACARAYAAWTAATEADMRPLSPTLRERVLAAHLEAGGKPPAPTADPVDPAAVEAVRRKVGLACSFCRDRLARPDVVYCAECLAPHHLECFRAHGRCCLPGCETTRFVRPQEAEDAAPRPRRRGLLVAGLGLCSAAALTAGAAQLYYSVIKLRYPRPTPLAEVLQPRAVPAQPGWTSPEVAVQLEAVNEPLGAVLDRLAADAETTILLAPELRAQPITVSASGDWRDVLRYVALQGRVRVDMLTADVHHVWQPGRVSLDLGEVQASRALQALAETAGLTVLIDPRLAGRVRARLEDRDPVIAVGELAAAAGGWVEWTGARTAVVTAQPLPAEVRAELTGFAPVMAGAPVTLSAREEPLGAVLTEIGRQVGRTVTGSDLVAGPRVTVELRGVPWRHAVAALGRLTGLSLVRDTAGPVGLSAPRPVRLDARGCPLGQWLSLLARVAARDLVATDPPDGVVDLGRSHVVLGAEDALRACAAAQGYRLGQGADDGRRSLLLQPLGWPALPPATPIAGGLCLQATASGADPAARAAVINGVLLVEGETSGDYRLGEGRLVLDEVQPGRVRVTQGGASRELTLGAPAETVAPPGGGD